MSQDRAGALKALIEKRGEQRELRERYLGGKVAPEDLPLVAELLSLNEDRIRDLERETETPEAQAARQAEEAATSAALAAARGLTPEKVEARVKEIRGLPEFWDKQKVRPDGTRIITDEKHAALVRELVALDQVNADHRAAAEAKAAAEGGQGDA